MKIFDIFDSQAFILPAEDYKDADEFCNMLSSSF